MNLRFTNQLNPIRGNNRFCSECSPPVDSQRTLLNEFGNDRHSSMRYRSSIPLVATFFLALFGFLTLFGSFASIAQGQATIRAASRTDIKPADELATDGRPLLTDASTTSVLESAANGRLPCEELLPGSTKAVFIIRDLNQLRQKLTDSQFAMLLEQEELEPFVAELRRKLESNLTDANRQLGFRFEEIRDVVSGEVAFATLLPAEDESAVAAIVDVEGNEGSAAELIGEVGTRMVENGAKELADLEEGGQTIKQYELELGPGMAFPNHVYFTLVDGFILASDHEQVIRSLTNRTVNSDADDFKSLASHPAQEAVTTRLLDSVGPGDPDVRWFVEPFGLSQALFNKLQEGDRGWDWARILKRHGFAAIQGIGGDLSVGVGEFELLHRSYVYAPPTADDAAREAGDRFEDSARLLRFPNSTMADQVPYSWIDANTSTMLSFNWDMHNAFLQIPALVDDLVGTEGAFERMLVDLKTDPAGPQVDLEKEIVENFKPRFMLITDTSKEDGITVDCERVMIVLAVENAPAVATGLSKIMMNEPNMELVEFEGHELWVFNPEAYEDEFDDPFITPFELESEDEEVVEEEASLAGWDSFAVVDGYLLIANDRSWIEALITNQAKSSEESDDVQPLAEAGDFQQMEAALQNLVGDEIAFRQFGRVTDVLEVTFELMRQGKMPESKSLIGQFLNRQLRGEDPSGVREQQIDPASFPMDADAFERLIAPALAPTGWAAVDEENGWFITGGMLHRQQAEKPETEKLETEESAPIQD